MLKNSLFQPSLSFCFSTFLPFSASAAAFLFLCFGCPFFLFSVPFLLAFSFSPTFLKSSLTQPKKPKRFLAFQPKRFCCSSATLSSCFFLLYSFLVQPKNVTFSPKRFFFFFSLGCPLFFSPSVQLTTFFSCFMSLYLSKSSFSSNLK